jgi:hypothetical protein
VAINIRSWNNKLVWGFKPLWDGWNATTPRSGKKKCIRNDLSQKKKEGIVGVSRGRTRSILLPIIKDKVSGTFFFFFFYFRCGISSGNKGDSLSEVIWVFGDASDQAHNDRAGDWG